MAQDTTPAPQPAPADGQEPRRPGFHYYSGGEIKELEHTNVSPLLWAGWTVVIIGAVLYLLFGGALGPNGPFSHGFQPTGGSAVTHEKIQTDLTLTAYGGETAQQADMRQLKPFLGGESLKMAITHGSNTYQNYCIGCHGPNQDGNGVNASSLNPKPRNLNDRPFMRETMNYQRINTSLHYGIHGTAMPRWENTLSDHEIQEVISYVLSLTWNMPPKADMDTTTQQLNSPMGMTSPATTPDTNAGLAGPGKSPSGSVTGTAGGSAVNGGSVTVSPAPITPTINGDPTAATNTAPPSQSGGQPGYVMPGGTR